MTDDLEADLVLISIDKLLFLREQMALAVSRLDDEQLGAAREVLNAALEATEVGKMKVWGLGEEPF